MPDPFALPAPGSPRVSVIVPASGRLDLLGACLGSLAREAPSSPPFETVVVLNAGGSAAEAWLCESAPGARVVASPVNLGLAGAANRGRAAARGDLLVLLHDDAEAEPGWLGALVEAADRHPEAGAIGSKVLSPDGSLQSAGMILWRDGTTSPPWAGERPPASAFDRRRVVDYCGTSSLLVRAATWDAVGGFDERFFPAYYVDVDFSMAVRRHGQVVLFEPASRIRHRRSSSTGERFRRFVVARNQALFLDKWGPALEDHESPGDKAPAIERALARREGSAARSSVLGGQGVRDLPDCSSAPVAPEPGGRTCLDPALQERAHLERDLALQRAYAAHLASALDEALAAAAGATRWREAAERDLDRERRARADLETELRALRAREVPEAELRELRARAATLAAVERGRWWRLYLRLLPLLRLLRGRR